MLIYFGCLAILPIGVVVAGLFTAPLFVLIIAVLFQGKRVGIVRRQCRGARVHGALLVIRPDPNALNLMSFLPVFAGLLYAIGAIATRAWCEGETTLTLDALVLCGAHTIWRIGVLVLPGGGVGAAGFACAAGCRVTGGHAAWYVALAIGAVIGIGCIFKGYQIGEAGFGRGV